MIFYDLSTSMNLEQFTTVQGISNLNMFFLIKKLWKRLMGIN